MTDSLLIRYGELTLKGKNRSRFEDRILTDIQWMLRDYAGLSFSRTFGRLYVELNGAPYPEVADKIRMVFGIQSFSPVRKAEAELGEIQRVAEELMGGDAPCSFKVSVKRTDKSFPHDSQRMNHLVASHVLRHVPGLTVNVHEPDVELKVEIREEGVFLYNRTEPGLGGYPLGSNGRALLMLSGGIDSPVAGWLSMRKGLKIEAVHYHSFPYTSVQAQEKVEDLTRKLAEYGRKIPLHLVPFTEIQTRLKREANENLLITLMRRTMFRIAERLAERRKAEAIITGESLGQVASQTLPSIRAIEQALQETPVLRPLVMMDKLEIIRLAERIGTYPISILPFEDCCTLFVPKNPSTNPNLRIIARLEERMDWLPELIEQAAEQTELRVVNREDKRDEISNLF